MFSFRLYILLILFLSNFHAFSQSGYVISGTVKDSESGVPIYNANIKEKSTKNGTTSNENGYFFLKVTKTPAILEFSHVAYMKSTYTSLKKGTEKIEVLLIKQIDSLPIVNISAHKVVNLVEKKFFDVVDYEFYQENILLLAYSYKDVVNPWLIMINTNGDTLFRSSVKNDGSLYRDCLGNIHLVTKELAYQIFIEGMNLNLLYPLNPDSFHRILDPCITEINNKFFIKQWSLHNQVLSYTMVNAEDTSKKTIKIISDNKAIRMLADRNRFYSMGTSVPTSADIRFEEMCFFNPIFAPMIKLKDKVCIFNFVESKLEMYNENGIQLYEKPVKFHLLNGWKKEIISDEITGKAYVTYKINGLTTVREIDLMTGTLMKEIRIPNFKYIENIKIRDGNLYFLYRINSPMELMKLYKMSI